MRGGDSYSRQVGTRLGNAQQLEEVAVKAAFDSSAIEAIRGILEFVAEPSVLLTSSGRVLIANAAFRSVIAVTPGDNLQDRMSPASWVRLNALLCTAARGVQADLEADLIDFSGKHMAMRASASPVPPGFPDNLGYVLLRLGRSEQNDVPRAPNPSEWVCHFPDRLEFIPHRENAGLLAGRLERLAQKPLSRRELAQAMQTCRLEGKAALYLEDEKQSGIAEAGALSSATELRLVQVGPQTGPSGGILAIARDNVLDPRNAERNLRLANEDPLTGLANRRAFGLRLQSHLENLKLGKGDYLALVYIDLDGFKAVNDQGGHETGDLMLGMVAQSLKQATEEYGGAGATVGRLGGDEFAVCGTIASCSDGLTLAWRVLDAIVGTKLERNGSPYRIGGSVGVVVVRSGDCFAGATASDIMHHADMASLAGKHIDEPTVFQVPWPPEDPVRIMAKWSREAGPRTPKAGELDLFVQPIRMLGTGQTVACEVFLRTPEEGRGKQSPTALVSSAVRQGFVSRIDCWVLDRVIDHLAAATPPAALSVNICGKSAASDELWQMLRSRLVKDPVLASSLCLEFQEADLLGDAENICSFMRRASSLGCQLAIDSFGGGWASVSMALELKVDWLKLDESLTKRVVKDEVFARITGPLVHHLAEAGIRSIAKSVETIEEYEALKAVGVAAVQGYLVGRPRRMAADSQRLR